ncbi:MAG: hypothetical protein ACTSSE_04930 [Candidatus Thorarchaeota archaeon]
MKLQTVSIAIATLVMLSALMFGASITNDLEYTLDESRLNIIPSLSQDEEYNVSSYHDFALASMDIIISRLMNFSTGNVFHAGDASWEIYQLQTSLSTYHWTIAALARAYESTSNITFSIAMSRAAVKMVDYFYDPVYPGFYVNNYATPETATTKRAGVQAYAYWALDIAESVNASLDFTVEKQSAITCLTDVLYDDVYGGFFFFTMRDGSLAVPEHIFEVYPNDGKRLDHVSLGAAALFDAGAASGNSTLIQIAEHATNFIIRYMKHDYAMELAGLRLAVHRNGTTIILDPGYRSGNSVVTDLNAIAMRSLMTGYQTTGNATYLSLVEDVFDALIANNWDTQYGAWFAEVLDGLPYDPLDDEDVKFYKYSEIQFQIVLALEQLYEVTSDLFPVRMVIDTLELVLTELWEPLDEGFVANSNQEWEVLNDEWEIHYTAVQSLGVLTLERIWNYGLPYISNVRVQPSNPRPHDLINFIATAHDSDGIDMVYVNYTLNNDGIMTTGILELIENPSVGSVYNSSMEDLADQTSCSFLVVANDTTGKVFIAGMYNFMVRADTFPPVVSLSAIRPTDEVSIGDNVIIDMDVYEFPLQSFVYDCELWWRVNSGPFNIVNMTFIGINGQHLIYRYNIGQFQAGDEIEFHGQIIDEAGNLGVSSRYVLTVVGPQIYVSPLAAWQIAAAVGLIAAPGVGYVYAQKKKGKYRQAQRDGKKDAKRRARRRGGSRSRRQD